MRCDSYYFEDIGLHLNRYCFLLNVPIYRQTIGMPAIETSSQQVVAKGSLSSGIAARMLHQREINQRAYRDV